MKVLIIASNNVHKNFAPFIVEQAEALRKNGCIIDYFGIKGKGVKGYIKAFKELKHKIKDFQPDIIHAHYGLSGLLANMQRRVPVVTTYHGSDINKPYILRFSKVAIKLSAWNIFVSQKNIDLASVTQKYSLLPCGIDIERFMPQTKEEARKQLGLDTNKKFVLFAGAFDNSVKNPELAFEAINLVDGAELLELKGYTREQVVQLMYAVDAFLMTSHTEGSPQVIKEAMACGCPIVSVDVGDVAEITDGVDGCYIVERTANDVAEGINNALKYTDRTNGRERIMERGLCNDIVAGKTIDIYNSIIHK